MATKAPQAGSSTPAQPPATPQQQGGEPSRPTQQQGGTKFTDWASI
ncbi:MAG: hypothetical protein ACK4TB_13100 [Gemmobacter sp.]